MTAQEAKEKARIVNIPIFLKSEYDRQEEDNQQFQAEYDKLIEAIRSEVQKGNYCLPAGEISKQIKDKLIANGYKIESRHEKLIIPPQEHSPNTGRVDVSLFGFKNPGSIKDIFVKYITWHD